MNTREFDLLNTPLEAGRTLLIEANAGTGKTYNIQHLYLRLLLERELEVGQILVVTFTEAATAELRDRIRGNLAEAGALLSGAGRSAAAPPDPTLAACLARCEAAGADRATLSTRVRTALGAFDEAAILTIHGFCHRMLAEHAFDSAAPFDRELLNESDDLLREFVTDFYRREVSARHADLPFPPDRREGSRAALMAWAKCLFARPEASPSPAVCDPAAAACEALLVARATPLPKRDSGFKRALQTLHDLPDPAPPSRLAAALADPELFKTTAQRNAPDLFQACETAREAPGVALRLKLRQAMNDPETGLEAHKVRRQAMTYDDLLRNLRLALRDASGAPDPEGPLATLLRRRFQAALIDEFQDTDPVQYEIFATLFNHPESLLLMIGDPKQAIYGFRGGDIYAYLAAADQVPDEDRRTLSRNYRATPDLIEAINHLFQRPAPFAEARIGYTPSRPPEAPLPDQSRGQCDSKTEPRPLECIWVQAADPVGMTRGRVANAFARETASRIVELVSERPYTHQAPSSGSLQASRFTPGDIAVLTPTHAEAERVRRALRQCRVPAVVYQSGNVFASDEAFLLAHVLTALDAPSRPTPVATALLLLAGPQVETNPAPADANTANDALAKHMETFQRLLGEWRQHGILAAFGRLQQAYDLLIHLAQTEHPERALTNLRHLLELLHRQETEQRLEPNALLRWLRERIDRADHEAATDAYEQRLDTDRQAVTVMTIHKSKGLEFPVVFCPFLWSREITVRPPQICHDPQQPNRVLLPLSRAAQQAYAPATEHEALSEQLRLIYVALTRASRRCVFFGGNFKQARSPKGSKSALHYLLRPLLPGGHLDAAAFLADTPPMGNSPPVFLAGAPIQVETIHETALGLNLPSYRPARAVVALQAPSTPRRVPDDWAIMSYSRLGRHDHAALPDDREELAADEGETSMTSGIPGDAPPEKEALEPYAALPGGNQTGLCLHAILEQLDFRLAAAPDWPQAEAAALIRRMALRYGLCRESSERASERLALLTQIVGNALQRELTPLLPGFRLTDLDPCDCRREMTFDFAVPRPIDLDPLRRIGLRFQPGAGRIAGFMTGSIDLVFRQRGRYYFLDWKSDRLGHPDAYHPSRLPEAMNRRGYTLQAMIYAVALHRLLQLRLGDRYHTPTHFGGGCYLLLRGLDATRGLHSVQPAPAELADWETLFSPASEERDCPLRSRCL